MWLYRAHFSNPGISFKASNLITSMESQDSVIQCGHHWGNCSAYNSQLTSLCIFRVPQILRVQTSAVCAPLLVIILVRNIIYPPQKPKLSVIFEISPTLPSTSYSLPSPFLPPKFYLPYLAFCLVINNICYNYISKAYRSVLIHS
jgi:hypothetical protein